MNDELYEEFGPMCDTYCKGCPVCDAYAEAGRIDVVWYPHDITCGCGTCVVLKGG